MSRYTLWQCTSCCNAMVKLSRPKKCPCGNKEKERSGRKAFDKIDMEDLQ